MLYTFHLPTKIIFAAGAISQAGVEVKGIGKKALVVTYPDMRKLGYLDRVLADLKENGVEAVVFEEVEPNPRRTTVEEAINFAKEKQVDVIIGLGGGSAMDAAKVIAVGALTSEPIWRYMTRELEVTAALPTLMIPTLAATGSEADHIAVVTDWETHEKVALRTPYIFPKVAVMDPELTLTLPAKITAQGGADIFSHAVERYLTTKAPFALTDGILETVLKMVINSLPKVLAKLDDIEARTQLVWASTVAMSQFGNLGGGAGLMPLHAIGHALSAFTDMAHGTSLAVLLPAWMRSIQTVRQERLALLGRNIFGEADGLRATEKWLEKVGMRLHLQDLGIKPGQFEDIADNTIRTALPGQLDSNPTTLDKKAIVQILKDCY